MTYRTKSSAARHSEQGMTLIMVAAGLFALLAVSALAIDLARLYVTRNEAQRAADAAALAGAEEFVTSGYTSGAISSSAVQSLATQQAESVGAQNLVAQQPAAITDGDVTFDFSKPLNPRISVVVQRSGVPTFFAKAFGVLRADVAARATAEVFNPSGGGPTFCASCLKPVVLPNCDPINKLPNNQFCPGNGEYIDKDLCKNPNYPGICHPGMASTGGVIGRQITIRPGLPSAAPVPSQYYSLAIGAPGANVYRQNIEMCSPVKFACGDTIPLETGRMDGPTRQGFSTLIHQPGQDTIDPTTLQISAGPGNPLVTSGVIPPGKAISMSESSSVVAIPVYQGQPLCPGKSCGATVTIVGYLQVFVLSVDSNANVTAVILNVAGCGGGTAGTCGTPGAIGGGGNLLPVRLIQNGSF